MSWTIYCHTHIDSGRRYVGLTKKTMLARWNQHVYTSNLLVKKGWSHFANAIRLYGKDAFSHEVLEVCETLEAANAAEERWIEKLGTRDPERGFNLMRGGQHVPHPIKNPWDRPEFRERQLESGKRKWSDPDFRKKLADHSKGLSEDPGFRERVSKAVKDAYDRNPDTKERVSSAIKAMWEDPGYREKTTEATRKASKDPGFRDRVSAGTKAAARSPENREARSRASKAMWADPVRRAQMTAAARARAADPAWRAKCAPKRRRVAVDPLMAPRSEDA